MGYQENKKITNPAMIDPPAQAKPPDLRVRWEGLFWKHSSLAHVNREICRLLCDTPQVELSFVDTRTSSDFDPTADNRLSSLFSRGSHPLSGPADIHVKQDFPPQMTRVREGRFALMQPWEFGYLPYEWVEPIIQNVDEVWCNSHFVRTVYANSGIPEDRLQLIPLGIDPAVFHPGAPTPDIPGVDNIVSRLKDKFVFIYVGGTIVRKGFDTLLAAYTSEFTRKDNVVLLIKDHATRSIYSKITSKAKIAHVMRDESQPDILYLDDEYPPDVLAGIFCMANCSVHPYRAEGFCLPALEAMACGVPVAATAGGPTDDFVDDTTGWRIPSKVRDFSEAVCGYNTFAGPASVLKVEVDDLACQMRSIYNNPSEAAEKGRRAAARAANWTWQHTADRVTERMRVMRDTPRRIRGMASQWVKPQ